MLIACGGVPRTLDLPGLRQVSSLNSYSILNLSGVPRSLLIIGGGVIALEIGQMLQRFGCQVTILQRGERPLAEFDPRLTGPLCGLLAAEGLHQHFGVEVQRVEPDQEGVAVHAVVHGRAARLTAERLMLAVGTAPATAGIGLETVGVALDRQGFVIIDAECRTSAAGIWAAGDVTGPPLLAPAGELEARVAVENMFAGRHCTVDHHGTPMAVFIDPEIAKVGQTAAQAAAAGHAVAEVHLDRVELVARALHGRYDLPGGRPASWRSGLEGVVVTTRIDMADYCGTAWRAIQCHRSQRATLGALADLHEDAAKAVLAIQGTFYRAFSSVNGGRKVETDLFEGI